jgi:zinc protease
VKFGAMSKAVRGVAAAFVVMWAMPALGASGEPPQLAQLANGMQVVVVEDRRAPAVTVMVWYKAGAADEVTGKSGIAHFLEHLMFTGTEKFPDGQFDALITRQGGSNNAFTSHDVTAYHQNVGSARLAPILELEADRMTNLVLDEARVAKERQVILEERNSSIDNQPGEKLSEQMNAAMFQNHRYGVEVLGWRHEMEALSLADAMTWYKTHYTPSNAILVVAGDVDMSTLKPLAETYFGTIPSRPVPQRTRAKEPPPVAARRVELRDPQVTQAELRRAYLAPSYVTGGEDFGVAMAVVADILGGGSSSILYRELVQNQRLAVSVSASYDGEAIDDSTFDIALTPAPGVPLAKLEMALDRVLARAIADGGMDIAIARAKTRLRAATIFARDDRETQANTYGWALAIGRSIADVHQWPDRVAKVNKAAVDAAARKVLRPERSVTGLLLPETGG